jgi:flagellin-like protein
MKRDSAGVSPVIATILLIAITVIAIGIVMVFVGGLGRPTPPLSATISASHATRGSTKLAIEHTGGDPIRNAFCGTSDNNIASSDNWINLEVRINGVVVITTENKTKFNGVGIGTGIRDFTVGDVLLLEKIAALNSGDVITIMYKPTNQQIARVMVP